MKTTVLGILSQTFTISKDNVMKGEKTIDGYNFHSQLREKFKLSEKDLPGTHKWRLDLYPNIYKNDSFEAHSIEREKGILIPRFWSTEGKGPGTGYPQMPAYYISLKRVTPLGEEKQINYVTELTDQEREFLVLEYKEILAMTQNNSLIVDTISSTNKHTALVHEVGHDSLAASAGQDNLGKILIAVMSFKRLQEKYTNDYKGGLILIDEIESTLHPAAQSRLIKRLYRYAKEFKIQFVFTTHSPTVIKSTFFDKYNTKEAKLLYLKKVGDKVVNFNDPKIDRVIAELTGEVYAPKVKARKIEVFSEDVVARHFLECLLDEYSSEIKLVNCSIGAEEYLELLRVGLDSVKNAIVILDGDKNNTRVNNKISQGKYSNVLFLPTNDCPEKLFYNFLIDLEPMDPFWDNELGGFDKDKCFSDYATLRETKADVDKYKRWYEAKKSNFGRKSKKLFNRWKMKEQESYQTFLVKFKQAYNNLADTVEVDKIE